MKTALLAILAIIPAMLIPAYADVVQFPTLTTDGLTGMDVQTFYPSNSTYTVQIVLQYHVEHPLELPSNIVWYSIDGTYHNIRLQEDFTMEHFPQEEVVIPDHKGVISEEEIDEILDQKKLELAQTQSSGYTKFRLCLEEFKEERPIAYQAWERIASLEEFTLSDQQLYADHPTVAETNANKKHQECEIRKAYTYVGVWEANKGLDHGDKVLGQDTTDAEETDPVTAEDIRQEEIKAEAFACSDQGKRQGLCKDYLAGEPYLIKKPRMPAWYGEYRGAADQEPDTQLAIDLAMLTQCEIYYPLYSATDAIELPTWLSHCEEQ